MRRWFGLQRHGLASLACFVCAGAIAHAGPPPPPLPSTAPAPTQPPHEAGHKPSAAKPKTTKPGNKPPHSADTTLRRLAATGTTADDIAQGAENPELRALNDAERELFPPALPSLSAPWPDEPSPPLTAPSDSPHVHASGLPPVPSPSRPPPAEGGHDLSWLSRLQLPPDLPVRWDPRVVRYLEFFKDDPRGRQLFAFWLRRSGRYRDAMRRSFHKKGLPEDLLWLSMIESGFDPAARSPAGAVGLWQFMPETGRLYGLSQDRWTDHRLNVQAATDAATEFLSDLYHRFGSWELTIAAYNMGYGGLVSVLRKYNTNDYWTLARLEGAVPWETTLYVPKLIAVAILTHNLQAFGYGDLQPDAPIETDEISVPPGTPMSAVAAAAGCTAKDVEALNLELRAGRTPPAPPSDPGAPPDPTAEAGYPVRVPAGKGAMATQNLAKTRRDQPALERYVVRFGESLEQIAASHKVPVSKLVELNAIAQGEVIRGGTVLLVPRVTSVAPAGTAVAAVSGGEGNATQGKTPPAVVVPAEVFVYANRKRVFYRVVVGDTLPAVATSLHVTVDDLRRWNDLDPVARLQEGMTLQAFVATDADLSHVAVLAENDVRVVPVGSEEFFAYWEGVRGRKRIVVTAKAGDTIERIGRLHQVSAAMMERVNHRPRSEVLKEGEKVIVYTPPAGTGGASGAALAAVVPVGAMMQRVVGPTSLTRELAPLPPIEMLPELP